MMVKIQWDKSKTHPLLEDGCKGKKNSCYDQTKENKKLKINQNMTDAPPFWHTFCEDMVNRMNRTIIKTTK